MRLIPTLAWTLAGDANEALDDRLLPLLDAVEKTESIAAAVVERGISYRAAWGLLREYHTKFGAPLVVMKRGRGTALAPLGQQLVLARRTAERRLETVLSGLGVDLAGDSQPAGKAAAVRIRIAASHDLVLAALPDGMLQFSPGLVPQLSFMGSLFALKEFAEGRADAAGFHVPIGEKIIRENSPFLRWLKPRTDKLIRFIDRDQGLILPRGNPARVRNFRDLTRRGLRFVNRQRGSGTRLLIDQILADAGIAPADLTGYANEEFTHGAVAATVASGGADAGFGLRAAAAEYQLDFVSVVRERYYLAVRAKEIDGPQVTRLVALLRSPAFEQHVRRYPGCNPAGAGTVVSLDALHSD